MPASARVRVGYLGPAGTFTEEALLTSAAPGAVEPVGLATIYDAVMALRRGEVGWSVVPIENSLDGSVSVTLDLLAEPGGGVEIRGEALLRVRHSLIASEPVELGEIETVLTHPQVPGQCQRFLRGELAGARVLPATSTAEAVRRVVEEGAPRQAALGTLLAAEIYGGTVLREAVQDSDRNETRFVWLGREGEAEEPPLSVSDGEEWKTSLVFWGPGADNPGWLVRCLDEFASRELNLTKIESRPRRERMGRYMFFADIEGHTREEGVAMAIACLRGLCEQVLVLGSYRAAVASA
ncbi:MAG TPA: prephenate dehydratase [Solirubrobacteraceae bacterium]|nr:prephenate dehydratase [Solirubrobacteraceae bacterium]